MNIIFEKITEKYILKVAKFDEKTAVLYNLIKNELSKKEIEYYENIKNEKRKKEWTGVRILLKDILKKYRSVRYDKYGNPFLDINKQISITHSGGLVGIIVSKRKEAGADIEIMSERILRTAHKFIPEEELKKLESDKNKLKKIYLHWCGREVLYKIKGSGGYDFKKDFYVSVPEVIKNNGKLISKIRDKETYELQYFFINSEDNNIVLVATS